MAAANAWRVSTGSRRPAHLLQPAAQGDIRNSAGKLAKGLDVRANGATS